MVLNRKGMSMAIQIFIVLFVLLAVAMLVLRLVTEQTEEQMRLIGDEQRKAEMKRVKSDCQSECKCDSLREKASYCLTLIESQTYGQGKMDFTDSGFADEYAEPAETAGLYGLCEDRIYCSQINEKCKCGNQELTMKNCFKIICTLWEEQGADTQALMSKFFPAPTCDMTDEQMMHHWSFTYLEEMACEEV